jgi:hypothetical protein
MQKQILHCKLNDAKTVKDHGKDGINMRNRNVLNCLYQNLNKTVKCIVLYL